MKKVKIMKPYMSMFYLFALVFILALSFNQTASAAEYGLIEEDEGPEGSRRGCLRRMPQLNATTCTTLTLAADALAVDGLSFLYASHFIGENRREYMPEDYLMAGTFILLPCLLKGGIHFDRFKALPSDVRAVREAYDNTSFLIAGSFCNTIMNHVMPVLILALSSRGDIPLPVYAAMSLPLGASNFYKGNKRVEDCEGGAFHDGIVECSSTFFASETAKLVLRTWYALPHACFMALGAHTLLSGLEEDPASRTGIAATVGILSSAFKFSYDSRKPIAGLERFIRRFPDDAYGRVRYVADLVGRTWISTLPTALLYTMGAAKMGQMDVASPLKVVMGVGLMFSILTEEGFALLPRS